MRKLLAIFALILLTQALTDKEILQQGFNGLFEQNKLAYPTTIVPCFDDATAHKLVVLIGDVFEKAAKGTISDLVQLMASLKASETKFLNLIKTVLLETKSLRLWALNTVLITILTPQSSRKR
jgi:hypothetical protein